MIARDTRLPINEYFLSSFCPITIMATKRIPMKAIERLITTP